MRLRSHLVLLVLAALVPVLGFAGLAIRENARLQLAATERGMRQTAHAVASTVDKTLESSITTLEALAESDALDTLNLRAFHALCRRVVRTQGWAAIRLLDLQGQALMDATEPLDAALPGVARPAEFRRARDERRPVVSGLFDAGKNRRLVAVYVPVVRGGAVRSVLSAVLPVATFGELLRAQQFGEGSIAVLQDQDHVIVARTTGEAELVGRRVPNPTPGLEGWTRSQLRDGTEVYLAFATAPLSRWRVVLTAPVEAVQAPLTRALWQMLAGAALAATLAGGVAFAFGRRIAGAVNAVVGIAQAVERNDPAEAVQTGVTEVDVVGEQLRAAANLARARERDAMVRERQARTMAEVAHALNASLGLEAVLTTAMDAVRSLVEADSARIALVDDAGRLVIRYSTSPSTAMPAGFVIERGYGIGGVAWATGRPVRTDDFATDPRFRTDRYLPIALADGIVSSMAVPIITTTGLAGVIYANNLTRRPFTAADEEMLVTLADHAAVAVQKARLLAREHAARAEAEAASRGKDELLAMLGHELRNPLSAIASAVHLLNVEPAPPEAHRRAREILTRQNAHLAHLVDDLLDVARVTSGKIVLSRRPLELAETVRHAVATLADSGRTDRHRLALDVTPVWADADDDPPGAGRHEPGRQRAQVHAGGRRHRDHAAGGGRDGRPARARHRRRHRRRRAPARVRHVRAGRARAAGRAGRFGAGADARAPHRGAARRHGGRGQRRPRARQRVRRPPARPAGPTRGGGRRGAARGHSPAPADPHRGGQRGRARDAAVRARAARPRGRTRPTTARAAWTRSCGCGRRWRSSTSACPGSTATRWRAARGRRSARRSTWSRSPGTASRRTAARRSRRASTPTW